MGSDQNGVNVQDILRKFEDKKPPLPVIGLTPAQKRFSAAIAAASRRSSAVPNGINRGGPVLQLRPAKKSEVIKRSTGQGEASSPPKAMVTDTAMTKRSVSEIARLFQVGNDVQATTENDTIVGEQPEATTPTPAPLKPVRTFAHDVYMNGKLVVTSSCCMVTRTGSEPKTSASKPRLPPKPVTRSKTVPNMPHRRKPSQDDDATRSRSCKVTNAVRRPSGPPPSPPAKTVAKTTLPWQRSFSDEHIYDEPAGALRGHQVNGSPLTMSTTSDEFVVVDNDIYGTGTVTGSDYIHVPYRLPYDARQQGSDVPIDGPKELHYMSTPVVTFPRGGAGQEVRRCRSRSVAGRKVHRTTGRPLGRRAVTDEDLVNWSFSSVYATTPRRRCHVGSGNHSGGKDIDSGDSDPEISEKQVRERIAYIHKISRGPSLKAESKMNDSTYRHQYDAVLTIGLQFSEDGTSLQPFVKDIFPRTDSVKTNIDSIARFCFPDAESWKPTSTGETHTFVLTNELGERLFGYCRKVKPEGANSSLPIVYCVISPILARAYYSQVLVEIEKRHGLSDAQMKGFLQALHNRSVPHPGRAIHLRCPNTDGDVRVALCRYNDYGLDNGDTFRLLTRMPISTLLKVYSCLLLERRVLFCSSSLNILTESVMALVALLYPFSWQHTLVPVLPVAMLDVVASPTPYVIGVMSNTKPLLSEVPIEEGIAVDLDESRVISEFGDEDTILPKKIQKGITASLKFIKHRLEASDSPCSSLISEAFLTMFAKVVGHYSDHVECLPDGQKMFTRDTFCAAPTSRSERLFLEWFTETQMFQIFIENKMKSNPLVQKDVFEKHIEKQRAEAQFYKPTIRTNVFDFGKKVKNFGEKLIGIKSPNGKV